MKTRFFALAALALLLGACTQDEAGFLLEGAEGTPIVFTATGLNPACGKGKSQPKCPERLRGQRPHRSRRTDGDLR